MSNEFNVGDKVIATQYLDWGSVPEGTEGVVTERSGGVYRVDFGSAYRDGDDAWWQDPDTLELVTTKYKVGDKVQFTQSRGGYGSGIGSTGTIIGILPGGRGYTVECPHTTGSGWSNLTFFENEIAGLVEEEPKRVYYRGFYSGTTDSGYRFWESNGEVVKADHGKPDSTASETGWHPEQLTTDPFFRPYGDEDTRSEMNRKMDTVREAGERRRQKVIAHTHRLEEVIRDKNAEIEFLRRKLTRAQNGVIQANDALYDANFRFVKPSKLANIPF